MDDAFADFRVKTVFGAGEEGTVKHHRLCAADDGGNDVGTVGEVAPEDERFVAVFAHLLQERKGALFDARQVVAEVAAFAACFHALQDEGVHAVVVRADGFKQVADNSEGEDVLFSDEGEGFAVGQTLGKADGARLGEEAALEDFGGEAVRVVALRLLRQQVGKAERRRTMVFAVGVDAGGKAVAVVMRSDTDDAVRAVSADFAGHFGVDEVEGQRRLPEGILAFQLLAEGVGDEVHA